MVFTDQDSRLDMTISIANFTYDHNGIHHPISVSQSYRM